MVVGVPLNALDSKQGLSSKHTSRADSSGKQWQASLTTSGGSSKRNNQILGNAISPSDAVHHAVCPVLWCLVMSRAQFFTVAVCLCVGAQADCVVECFDAVESLESKDSSPPPRSSRRMPLSRSPTLSPPKLAFGDDNDKTQNVVSPASALSAVVTHAKAGTGLGLPICKQVLCCLLKLCAVMVDAIDVVYV